MRFVWCSGVRDLHAYPSLSSVTERAIPSANLLSACMWRVMSLSCAWPAPLSGAYVSFQVYRTRLGHDSRIHIALLNLIIF
jgi:hypothetical protein